MILFNGNARQQMLAGHTVLGVRQWHHVALVREGRKASLYLDGQPEASGELDQTLPAGETSVFLGGRSDNCANLEGNLDEARKWAF